MFGYDKDTWIAKIGIYFSSTHNRYTPHVARPRSWTFDKDGYLIDCELRVLHSIEKIRGNMNLINFLTIVPYRIKIQY